MILGTVRTVASLSPELRTLFATTLLFRAGTMALPFLAAYLLSQGRHHPTEVGVIVGAFGLGALLADLSASMFLGRVPAHAVLVASPVLYAAVLAVMPALTSVAVLFAATVLWGFAFEIFTPAVYSRIVDHSSPAERKVVFSCNRLAINIGMGIGPALGGLVFAVKPVAVFYVNAVCVLGAAAILLSRAERGQVSARPRTAARTPIRLVSPTVRGETRFWTIFGLAIPIHLAYALPPIVLSVYVIEGLGLPSYWASLVFLVNALVIVLFEVPLNKAMASMSYARSLVIGYALTAVGFALMGVSQTGAAIVLVTLVWTAGEMIVFPSLISYVSDLSDPSVSNRNVSLYSAGVNIGFVAAPQISLALASWGDLSTPWLAAGLTVGLAMVLMLGARFSSWTWQVESADPALTDTAGAGR